MRSIRPTLSFPFPPSRGGRGREIGGITLAAPTTTRRNWLFSPQLNWRGRGEVHPPLRRRSPSSARVGKGSRWGITHGRLRRAETGSSPLQLDRGAGCEVRPYRAAGSPGWPRAACEASRVRTVSRLMLTSCMAPAECRHVPTVSAPVAPRGRSSTSRPGRSSPRRAPFAAPAPCLPHLTRHVFQQRSSAAC